jgi:two-component system, LuxR family, response regulator FixJ
MPEIIHVIDDDEGVRDSLCVLLETKGYTTRAHGSCQDFLSNLSVADALCVVADMRMPEMGGLDLQKHLLEKSIDLPFIVITGHGDVPSAVQALKSGAVDFIEKPLKTDLFLAAISRAVESRRARLQMTEGVSSARQRIAALTPREHDVLRHLIAGHPNKIIAFELGISARTVENHRARLMVKMQADSLAELVRISLEAGAAAK